MSDQFGNHQRGSSKRAIQSIDHQPQSGNKIRAKQSVIVQPPGCNPLQAPITVENAHSHLASLSNIQNFLNVQPQQLREIAVVGHQQQHQLSSNLLNFQLQVTSNNNNDSSQFSSCPVEPIEDHSASVERVLQIARELRIQDNPFNHMSPLLNSQDYQPQFSDLANNSHENQSPLNNNQIPQHLDNNLHYSFYQNTGGSSRNRFKNWEQYETKLSPSQLFEAKTRNMRPHLNQPQQTQMRHQSHNQQRHSDSTFNEGRCLKFFRYYASIGTNDASTGSSRTFRLSFSSNPTQMNPDGIERFCHDLGVPVNDFSILYISMKMQAKLMGVFKESEFLKGMSELKCDNLIKLKSLIPAIQTFINDPNVVKEVWRFAFDFAREQESRSLDIETAKQIFKMLLTSWPMLNDFITFLEKTEQKAVNRDQYYSVLDFAHTENISYETYSEYSAWPVLFDEFVDYIRNQRASLTNTDQMMTS